MMMSLNLIPVSLSNDTLTLVSLLPDEPVFKRTAAALEDEVVEVGAAGDGRDVEDAGLLACTSAVSSCPSSSPPSCFSLVTFWSLQRRLMIFLRSYCDVPLSTRLNLSVSHRRNSVSHWQR